MQRFFSFLSLYFALSYGLFLSTSAYSYYPKSFTTPLQTIAFGSCNHADGVQGHWNVISRQNPDLWIWLGDNIYTNTTDPVQYEAMFQSFFKQPEYTRFREDTPIIGTWDDHDFGKNNADGSHPNKKAAQKIFLNFLEEPENTVRRQQEGIFTSYDFGPEDRKVKIILLDNRYFMHKLFPSEILGEAQWAWLEKELKSSTARVHILVSSIQFANKAVLAETWGRFSKERSRMLQLLSDSRVPGAFFLSGDRHFGALNQVASNEFPAYPLWDITSSRLNFEDNGESLEPSGDELEVLDPNFGTIQINWDADPVEIKLEVRNKQGKVRLNQALTLDQMQFP